MMGFMASSRRVINVYYFLTAVYTLAASMIWGINTLFLMDAGLDIFQVMVVNAFFTGGMVLFEIPTGVVADTIGRKASFLLCILILLATTLLYVATAHYGWGFVVFMAVSPLIGLGFTFYTGAVEAWLVDALDYTAYEGPKEKIFSRGQIVFSVAMLVGTVGGGFLGQINLSLPYLVRAGLFIPAFIITLLFMKDLGFDYQPLNRERFIEESRKIFVEGVNYGRKHPVIKWCFLASLVEGLFFIYGWYSWQRYFLDLLAKELVWVAGIVSALVSISMITGNALVDWLAGGPLKRASILAVNSIIRGAMILAAGLTGFLIPAESRGVAVFSVAVFFYLLYAMSFGISRPVRMAFINRYIPSKQRATILSVDSLFDESGSVAGQIGLGFLSKTVSIPLAWILGGAFLFIGYPLYKKAGRGEAGISIEDNEQVERIEGPGSRVWNDRKKAGQ
jgi:MFS family permease